MPDLYELEEIEQPPIPSVTMPDNVSETTQDLHVLPTPGPQGEVGSVPSAANLLLWYENAKVGAP